MSRRREFAIFLVPSAIGLVLDNALLWAGVEFLDWHYPIVKLFATAAVTMWNFATRKVFSDAGKGPRNPPPMH